jgi:hypothetical protein
MYECGLKSLPPAALKMMKGDIPVKKSTYAFNRYL